MERDTVINRPPAVAGSFYPASPAELKSTLDKLFLSSAPSENLNNIAAIISPHAGYVYSGTVAASAFNQLSQDVVYDNIFLIGSSHHVSFDGAALYSIGNYVTPLGLARVNLSITKKLLNKILKYSSRSLTFRRMNIVSKFRYPSSSIFIRINCR